MNTVIVNGRIGKDPEVRYTQGGQAVCNFAIANSRKWKKGEEWQEETTWLDVEVWGKSAESIGQRGGKGLRALVNGRLKQDKWEKDGQKYSRIKIVAEHVELLDKKEASENHPNVEAAQKVLQQGAEQEPQTQEDIPF